MGDRHDPYEAQAEQRREEVKKAAEREIDDLRWLMSEERGRRIVWRLLERSMIFQPSFSSDALVMSFNEGRRRLGLEIMEIMSPDMYHEMLKEHKENGKR